VAVRIGVESGVAMAGDFGTSFRSIYTAVGDSVNNNLFDPAVQWGGFATDTFGNLGAYGCAP